MSKIGIFIFRRDFRTQDNTALIKCDKECDIIYPIFIFTPEQVDSKKNDYRSLNAIRFMTQSLEEMNSSYLDDKLNYFYGDYLEVLNSLLEVIKKEYFSNEDSNDDFEIKSSIKIYANADYSPYGLKRDIKIRKMVSKWLSLGLNIKLDMEYLAEDDITLFQPGSIVTGKGTVYQKFTPFYNKTLDKKFPSVDSSRINKSKYHSFKQTEKMSIIKKKIGYGNGELAPDPNRIGGRKAGLKILRGLKSFKNYDDTRNTLSLETTELSAYLKFGCLSIREVYHQMLNDFDKKHPLIRQLIWREFYYHVGYGFQVTLNNGNSMKEEYDKIKWKGTADTLQKWKDGETGFPIVDACMKQINQTGYMHNRGRLIVASFLVKNLQHDWRKGEKYFSQRLIDIDWLVNNGNWQWVAGSGADSQPYFRIFNPWTQSKKFDPKAEYIKKWLPQLKDIPAKHLHKWDEHLDEYDLDKINYHAPIIDYKKSRELALDMYKKAFE